MRYRRVLPLALAVLLMLVPMVKAEPKLVTSIEGITEFKLDNGMSVLLFPDDSKPTVTVNMTVFVGSRHEGYGEAGMAHLLEHMLFKGTPTHTDIPKLLKDRGAQFNGTTWLDRTNYYETLPSTDENLEFAIRFEADRMMNSRVAGEDLKSEFSVVRNEFERGENNAMNVLEERMVAASFLWHNYGNSTIGNRADIERVPIERLRAFYRKYYQPDNAMLVVAGKFDPKKGLGLANKYFGTIAKPERVLEQTYTQEPAQDGEKFVTLRRVGDVAAVGAVYHIPAGPHPEYAAVDVLETVLTAQPAGRLYKALVESKKASQINGATYALHDPGVMMLLAEVNKGNDPQLVLEALIDTVEGVGDSKVTDEEVDRAKQKLLKQRELAQANSTQLAIELSEWAAQGDWRLYFIYRDRLEKVDAAQVQHVAKTYFKRNNRTVGVYIPTKESDRVSIPETPDIAKMIGDYKGRAAVAAGEAFDVSPDNIEKRTTRTTLNGGLKVTLLPKKTRGESVQLKLTLRYGSEQSLQNAATLCEFLPVLMTRGTEKLTRQQLQDALDKNLTQLVGGGSAGEMSFSLQTKKPQMSVALDLLKQVLRTPTIPAEELEILRNEAISQAEQSLSEPQALAQTAALRAISPYPKGHPLYKATIEEEIAFAKAITREQLLALYKNQVGAAAGELSVVGDFDPAEMQAALKSMLGDWTAKESYVRIPKTGNVKVEGKSQAINTPDKANATYFALTVFEMRDDDPDYPALVMGNFMLGGGALSSRLANRVRQKEGLSYGVGSGFTASAVDRRAVLYMFAISNPENTNKVKAAIREELDKLLKDGVSEDELASAKKGYLQAQSVGRSNDGSLATTLNKTSEASRTMAYHAQFEQRINSVTSADVLTALKKYIALNRIVIVTAGDFAKAEK